MMHIKWWINLSNDSIHPLFWMGHLGLIHFAQKARYTIDSLTPNHLWTTVLNSNGKIISSTIFCIYLFFDCESGDLVI